MWILYDLIAFLILIFYLPIYLFRRKFHKGFLARLGILPRDVRFNHPVWIHAVSVGEAMAVKPLITQIKAAYPGKQIVFSTVTPTGNKIVRAFARPTDVVTYLPLDISFIVRRVLRKVEPSLFIIVETELWPNLISCLKRKRIPVAVVNGRISDASFRGYASIRFLLQPLLQGISLFCVRSERDAKRLTYLGVNHDKIKITGNMKFDAVTASHVEEPAAIREKMGLLIQDKLLVCGSTHPGEEQILLRVFKELLAEFPALRLLLAPRHPERAQEVARVAHAFGFSSVFISEIQRTTQYPLRTTIFILDTIGELTHYYAAADIVFIGGSLVKIGGHNILEPAAVGKPVLFGPHMSNFRDIAELFLREEAALMVKDELALKETIRSLLTDPDLGLALTRHIASLLQRNQGATHTILSYLRIYLQ